MSLRYKVEQTEAGNFIITSSRDAGLAWSVADCWCDLEQNGARPLSFPTETEAASHAASVFGKQKEEAAQ